LPARATPGFTPRAPGTAGLAAPGAAPAGPLAGDTAVSVAIAVCHIGRTKGQQRVGFFLGHLAGGDVAGYHGAAGFHVGGMPIVGDGGFGLGSHAKHHPQCEQGEQQTGFIIIISSYDCPDSPLLLHPFTRTTNSPTAPPLPWAVPIEMCIRTPTAHVAAVFVLFAKVWGAFIAAFSQVGFASFMLLHSWNVTREPGLA